MAGDIILIYPPAAKPCEPPPGIARLAGALDRHGVKNRVLDANLEGFLHLLQSPVAASDTWTRRSQRNIERNLASLRNRPAYRTPDRYKRAVMDVNRVLETASAGSGAAVSLANYQHRGLSPVRSADLLRAAEHPAQNPFYSYFKKRLPEILDEGRPSIIGFSLNFLGQALCTFAMAGFLKKNFPGLTLIAGGGLVTSWMKNKSLMDRDVPHLFQGLFDHFVAGPGEKQLLSLAGISAEGEGSAPGHYTPDYGCFPAGEYLSPGFVLPYSASNGCYWNACSFCPEKAEGNPYIPVPADRATADLQALAAGMDPVLVHLLDSAISPALLTALAEKPLGVPWYGFARISRHLADRDFCMALKRSGCVMLKLGLESGDQDVLDSMQKGVDLKTAAPALEALKEAGIATYVYLLFGTPQETLQAARRTLAFTVEHHDRIGFLNLAIFNMPLNAPGAQDMMTGSFYEGDLSLYTDFEHPLGWSRKLVRQFLDDEFKKHAAVAGILRRDPPFFTSNHAPFFVPHDEWK